MSESQSESQIDKRGKLEEEPFDYQAMNDGRVFVYYHNKHVKTLKGDEAKKLLTKVTDASEAEIQLALAKVTGNFKRGNER